MGMFVGALIAEVTGFRIPGYEYIYGQSKFRDLFARQEAATTGV